MSLEKRTPSSPGLGNDHMKTTTQYVEKTNEDDIGTIITTPSVDAASQRKIMRKMNLRIIPMVTVLYLLSFLDRGYSSAHC